MAYATKSKNLHGPPYLLLTRLSIAATRAKTFSTLAFGSPAQMFHVKHRTERNAGGWDPPLNRNRHDRSPPGSELRRADVGATATDRQNRAGAAEGVDFAGWGGLHGRAPGFGRSRGLGRWRICAAIKPVCDI